MSKLDVGRIRGRNAAGTLSDCVGCCWDCAGVLSVGSLSFLLIRDVLEGSSTGGLSTILHAHLEPSCADISTLNSTASTFQSPSGPATRPLQSLFSRLSPRSFFPLHYFLADFLQTKWSTFLSEFRHGGTIRKSGLDCAATDVCYCTGFLRFFAARASVGPHLPDLVFRQLVSPTFRHTFSQSLTIAGPAALTASTRLARSTPPTRLPSTRRARTRFPPRVSVVTTGSRAVTVVRPSPSSTRRPRP